MDTPNFSKEIPPEDQIVQINGRYRSDAKRHEYLREVVLVWAQSRGVVVDEKIITENFLKKLRKAIEKSGFVTLADLDRHLAIGKTMRKILDENLTVLRGVASESGVISSYPEARKYLESQGVTKIRANAKYRLRELFGSGRILSQNGVHEIQNDDSDLPVKVNASSGDLTQRQKDKKGMTS